MIESITCDTDVSELISIADVLPYLTDMESQITDYKKNVTDKIKFEQENGGLSTEGFSIDSDPLLYNSANEVISFIDSNSSFDSYKNSVLEAVEDQRERELTQLRTKIVQKIVQLEKEAFAAEVFVNNEENKESPDYIKYFEILRRSREQANRYKDKLQSIEGLV